MKPRCEKREFVKKLIVIAFVVLYKGSPEKALSNIRQTLMSSVPNVLSPASKIQHNRHVLPWVS